MHTHTYISYKHSIYTYLYMFIHTYRYFHVYIYAYTFIFYVCTHIRICPTHTVTQQTGLVGSWEGHVSDDNLHDSDISYIYTFIFIMYTLSFILVHIHVHTHICTHRTYTIQTFHICIHSYLLCIHSHVYLCICMYTLIYAHIHTNSDLADRTGKGWLR